MRACVRLSVAAQTKKWVCVCVAVCLSVVFCLLLFCGFWIQKNWNKIEFKMLFRSAGDGATRNNSTKLWYRLQQSINATWIPFTFSDSHFCRFFVWFYGFWWYVFLFMHIYMCFLLLICTMSSRYACLWLCGHLFEYFN